MKNENGIILSARQVDFIKHFCTSYKINFSKGRFEEANHDSVAITLFFCEIFDEINSRASEIKKKTTTERL